MIDNLKRFRQPLAIIVILAIVASIAISLVRLVIELTTGDTPVFAAFQDIANSAMNLTLVVLLVVLVWGCLFVAPATKDAVRITRVAAWVVTGGTLLTLVATLLGLSASAGVFGVILEFMGGLLDIILKAVAAGVLWIILRAIGGGRLQTPPAAEPVLDATPSAAPAVEPPVAPPAWRPSEASGSVWRTAQDAAAGTPAAAHGTPGEETRWRPVERNTPTSGENSPEIGPSPHQE